MAKPGVKNLDVYQGDDHRWGFRMSITLPGGGSEPTPLTGYSFQAQVRSRNADADAGGPPLATLPVVVTDAAQGAFEVELPAEESVKLVNNCRWDLQMVHDATGEQRTILAGDVLVTKEVTRVTTP